MGPHDNVVVTAIPHAMDENIGALLPPFTGAPSLGNRTRVIKWQIGYSFPSLSYFVDELQACRPLRRCVYQPRHVSDSRKRAVSHST